MASWSQQHLAVLDVVEQGIVAPRLPTSPLEMSLGSGPGEEISPSSPSESNTAHGNDVLMAKGSSLPRPALTETSEGGERTEGQKYA